MQFQQDSCRGGVTPPLLANFENCQIALEFCGKDIKIRQENITERRINNETWCLIIYKTSGSLKTMESL
jgi:hypothetical protein